MQTLFSNSKISVSRVLYVYEMYNKFFNFSKVTGDDRWDSLRDLLTGMRDKDVDPDDLVSSICSNDLEELKDKYTLKV